MYPLVIQLITTGIRRRTLLRLAACLFVLSRSAGAAPPSPSVSLVAPDAVQVSWPSNFTSGNWQLLYSTNLAPPDWQPAMTIPFPLGDRLVALLPLTDLSGFYRLQQIGAMWAGGDGCSFQASPAVITSGASSTLNWCPQAGTSYSISPGPGSVSGSSLPVSPTITTTYSLTASNAFGVKTDNTTVVVNPCGWLRVQHLRAGLSFFYHAKSSTPAYDFDVFHGGYIVFDLRPEGVATATDAYFFGFATTNGGTCSIEDVEVVKSGSTAFTTTEVGHGVPELNLSYLSLHLTCNSYDFNYSVSLTTTETTSFSVTTSDDGVAAGVMASRPLTDSNEIFDSAHLTAQYPPSGSEYFVPDSDVGKAFFTTGSAAASSDVSVFRVPLVVWEFTPIP